MTIRLAVNATSLLSPLTGIGRYTYHLMGALEDRKDVDIEYFYATGWSANRLTKPLNRMPTIKKIIKSLMPNSYQVSRAVQQYAFHRGVRKRRVDLYHEPNFVPFEFGGPTVVTVHDLSFARYPESHPRQRVEILERFLPLAIERASQVIVDSEYVRQEVINFFGVLPEMVHTTLLGVDDTFRPMTAEQTNRVLGAFGLRHKGYLLVVATLEPRKNLMQVLRAYEQLGKRVQKGYPLVIVGMKGWNLEVLESRLQSFVEKGQVRLLGYVSNSELATLYAGARIFLYPSLYEGFGLPPLEAMASGVPVITSNVSSLPEVVGDAGIMVSPDDDLGLVEAINGLLESSEESRVRGALGMERAKRFSWKKCADQTMKVYERALGE